MRYDTHMNVLSLLAERGVIKEDDVAAITKEAREGGIHILPALENRGIGAEQVLGAESDRYGIPYRILPKENPSEESSLAYIPEDSARHYRFVPLALEDVVLAVGIVDPDNIEAQDALQFISTKAGLPYKLFLISATDFDRVIE